MPYLSFDLDAKKRALRCATAVGLPVGSIVWGLLELWEHAWAAKNAVVTEMALDGCFGPGERIRAALVEFGFLEALDGGTYRVKGAERYLRISEAQSAAGKKRARGARNERGELVKRDAAPSSSPAPHQLSASRQPALTPSTEHPTPEEKKPSRVREPVDPRRAPLLASLRAIFREVTGSEMAPGGVAENVALVRLLGLGTDEEIRSRWRQALCLGAKWPGCSALEQLASPAKWNALAAAAPPERNEDPPCRMLTPPRAP